MRLKSAPARASFPQRPLAAAREFPSWLPTVVVVVLLGFTTGAPLRTWEYYRVPDPDTPPRRIRKARRSPSLETRNLEPRLGMAGGNELLD